jgi:hypothetical protein
VTRFTERKTSMMRPFVMLAAACLTACNYVNGDGKLMTKTHDPVDAFTDLSIGGGLTVKASTGPQKVTLTVDDNLFDYFHITVANGVLSVQTDPGVDVQPSKGSTLELVTPTLCNIELSGATLATADVSACDAQTFDLSGSSELTTSTVVTQQLTVQGSGASTFTLSGTAPSVTAHLSGASHLKSTTATGTLNISLSGASTGDAVATQSVSGDLSGSSELTVTGAPQNRNVSTSGSSTVTYR